MNWYVVKIVFRIISGDGKHDAQFDEQLRLITAEDDKQAYLKAKAIGVDSQESFMNSRQQPVRWEFIDVAEINPIIDLIDGAELYSIYMNRLMLKFTKHGPITGRHCWLQIIN